LGDSVWRKKEDDLFLRLKGYRWWRNQKEVENMYPKLR